MPSYTTIIGLGFSGVECHSIGDDTVYENIVWDGGLPLPTKEALDAWYTSNQEQLTDHKITVLAFRNRFTQAEKIALDLASIDNPSASAQQRQFAAALRVMQDDLRVATYIDLTRQDTIAGVQSLETYGIIASGRASQILTNPITDIERPPIVHTIIG